RRLEAAPCSPPCSARSAEAVFGKRIAQPGLAPAPPRPVPASAPKPAARRAPEPLDGFSADDLDPLASPAAAPRSDRLDALDGLIGRPAEPAPGAGGSAAGPRATPGLEQLKKAQAVAEIVREQR